MIEYARNCTARVYFEYFNTDDPASISYNFAFKYLTFDSTIYNTGGTDPGYDVERIAEDSTVERWAAFPRSNFYVRRTIYVTQPSISLV